MEKDSYKEYKHTRNLGFLAVEMFKVVTCLAPTIINNLFPLKERNIYLGNAAIGNAKI